MRYRYTFLALILFSLLGVHSFAEEMPNIKLESSFIGDKEQPSVSYFIPWEEVGTPDNLQWNITPKYDNTLRLVDREVLIRSISVYTEMGLEN